MHPTRDDRKQASWIALLALIAGVVGCQQAEEPGRVFFIGLDGATWKVIGSMLDRGELPAFRRLTTEGAYSPALDTLSPTISPRLSTTIATGRAAEDHGVVDFTEELPNGEKIPVSGNVRKVKALWRSPRSTT